MLSIEECRTLLGDEANGKSDAQVEAWRDSLTPIANQMFDHLQSKVRAEREVHSGDDLPGFPALTEDEQRRDALERVRWIAYAHENPDDEDAK